MALRSRGEGVVVGWDIVYFPAGPGNCHALPPTDSAYYTEETEARAILEDLKLNPEKTKGVIKKWYPHLQMIDEMPRLELRPRYECFDKQSKVFSVV